MKIRLFFVLLALGVVMTQVSGVPGVNAREKTNWKPVDDAMGRPGQDQPDGAHKYAMPRSDLKVTVDGVALKAGFALGSWADFSSMGSHSDVMGDLVLTESEIGPVMQKLIDSVVGGGEGWRESLARAVGGREYRLAADERFAAGRRSTKCRQYNSRADLAIRCSPCRR